MNEFSVDVIQYKRPDGRSVNVTTLLPIGYEDSYRDMGAHDCRFEAEVLMDGHVSLTISNNEEDLDIEVVSNGPEVQKAMVKMLEGRVWQRVSP